MTTTKLLIALGMMGNVLWGQTAAGVSLRVSDETVPPGGVAQIKVSLTEPKPIVRTGFWSEMDESVFGDLLGIHAAGNLSGLARYAHGKLEVDLATPGVAATMQPDYPVLTMAVEVKDNVPVGTQRAMTLDLGSMFWLDPQGRPYPQEVHAGSVTVGGRMFVSNVLPGGGTMSAGETISVTGGGFDAGVKVRAEGLRLASVTPTELTLRAKAAMKLDGVDIRVTNQNKEQQEYFSYLRGIKVAPSSNPALVGVVPVYSTTAASLAATGIGRGSDLVTAIGIQNPAGLARSVKVQVLSVLGAVLATGHYSLGAQATALRTLEEWIGGAVPANGYAVLVSAGGAFQMAAGTISSTGALKAQPVVSFRPASY